jgi:hypothetical protein
LYVALSSIYVVLSCEPKAHVSVQVREKDGGDHTPQRSITTKREPIRPPPLHVINNLTGSGSSFAQELPNL